MKSELVFLLVRFSLTYLFWGGKFKAMRKCSVTDSQGWRGEEPKLGKQTLSRLNIETKPGEVAHKVQENRVISWRLNLNATALCSVNPGHSELQSLTWSTLQFLKLRLPSFLFWEQAWSGARGYDKK